MSSEPRRIHVRESRTVDLPDEPLTEADRENIVNALGLLVEDAYRDLRRRADERTWRRRSRGRGLAHAA